MRIYKERVNSEFVSDLLSILEFKDKVEVYPKGINIDFRYPVSRSKVINSRLSFKYNDDRQVRVVYYPNTNRYSGGSTKSWTTVMVFDKEMKDLEYEDMINLADKLRSTSGIKQMIKEK